MSIAVLGGDVEAGLAEARQSKPGREARQSKPGSRSPSCRGAREALPISQSGSGGSVMGVGSQRAKGAASVFAAALAAALVMATAGSASADCAGQIIALEKKIQAENPGLGGMPGDPAAASAVTAPAGTAPAPTGGPDPLAAADASGADAAIANPPLAGPVAAMNKLSEANALQEAGDEEGCLDYLRQAEALLKKK
jgi:hypothetical protein